MDSSAVAAFARHLGMDPVRDADCMWIAEQAVDAKLPEDWVEYADDSGYIYYYNVTTGETTWEHPMDSYFRNLFRRYRISNPRSPVSSSRRSASPTTSPPRSPTRSRGHASPGRSARSHPHSPGHHSPPSSPSRHSQAHSNPLPQPPLSSPATPFEARPEVSAGQRSVPPLESAARSAEDDGFVVREIDDNEVANLRDGHDHMHGGPGWSGSRGPPSSRSSHSTHSRSYEASVATARSHPHPEQTSDAKRSLSRPGSADSHRSRTPSVKSSVPPRPASAGVRSVHSRSSALDGDSPLVPQDGSPVGSHPSQPIRPSSAQRQPTARSRPASANSSSRPHSASSGSHVAALPPNLEPHGGAGTSDGMESLPGMVPDVSARQRSISSKREEITNPMQILPVGTMRPSSALSRGSVGSGSNRNLLTGRSAQSNSDVFDWEALANEPILDPAWTESLGLALGDPQNSGDAENDQDTRIKNMIEAELQRILSAEEATRLKIEDELLSEEGNAATQIQRMWRGVLGRRRFRILARERMWEKPEVIQQVIRAQAVARRWLNRSKLVVLLEQIAQYKRERALREEEERRRQAEEEERLRRLQEEELERQRVLEEEELERQRLLKEEERERQRLKQKEEEEEARRLEEERRKREEAIEFEEQVIAAQSLVRGWLARRHCSTLRTQRLEEKMEHERLEAEKRRLEEEAEKRRIEMEEARLRLDAAKMKKLMEEEEQARLERERREAEEAAFVNNVTKSQARVRGWLARRTVGLMKEEKQNAELEKRIVKTQASVRGWIARRKVGDMRAHREAMMRLQAEEDEWRRIYGVPPLNGMPRQVFEERMVMLQRRIRQWVRRKRARELQEWMDDYNIQSMNGMTRETLEARIAKSQRAIRQKLARARLARIEEEKERLWKLRQETAALIVQRNYRMYRSKKEVERVRRNIAKQEKERRRASAVRLQSFFRQSQAKKELHRRKTQKQIEQQRMMMEAQLQLASVQIQSAFRSYLAKKRSSAIKTQRVQRWAAAIKIQNWWQIVHARTVLLRRKQEMAEERAIVHVQRLFRGLGGRIEAQRRRILKIARFMCDEYVEEFSRGKGDSSPSKPMKSKKMKKKEVRAALDEDWGVRPLWICVERGEHNANLSDYFFRRGKPLLSMMYLQNYVDSRTGTVRPTRMFIIENLHLSTLLSKLGKHDVALELAEYALCLCYQDRDPQPKARRSPSPPPPQPSVSSVPFLTEAHEPSRGSVLGSRSGTAHSTASSAFPDSFPLRPQTSDNMSTVSSPFPVDPNDFRPHTSMSTATHSMPLFATGSLPAIRSRSGCPPPRPPGGRQPGFIPLAVLVAACHHNIAVEQLFMGRFQDAVSEVNVAARMVKMGASKRHPVRAHVMRTAKIIEKAANCYAVLAVQYKVNRRVTPSRSHVLAEALHREGPMPIHIEPSQSTVDTCATTTVSPQRSSEIIDNPVSRNCSGFGDKKSITVQGSYGISSDEEKGGQKQRKRPKKRPQSTPVGEFPPLAGSIRVRDGNVVQVARPHTDTRLPANQRPLSRAGTEAATTVANARVEKKGYEAAHRVWVDNIHEAKRKRLVDPAVPRGTAQQEFGFTKAWRPSKLDPDVIEKRKQRMALAVTKRARDRLERERKQAEIEARDWAAAQQRINERNRLIKAKFDFGPEMDVPLAKTPPTMMLLSKSAEARALRGVGGEEKSQLLQDFTKNLDPRTVYGKKLPRASTTVSAQNFKPKGIQLR